MAHSNGEPRSALREFLVPLSGVIATVTCLAIWYFLKASVIDLWWGRYPFFFMPTVIGLCVGGAMRFFRVEGTFGLAGLAVMLVAVVSCMGMGMQYWFNINKRVQQFADTAYNETLEYAKQTTAISNEKLLRQALMTPVAVVGRWAATDGDISRNNFWLWRNYLHFHWIAARQIKVFGEGGADKTIWEATKIKKDDLFMDIWVKDAAKEPVSDENISNFQQREFPFLHKLADGEITREDFETPLLESVHTSLKRIPMTSRGFDPLTGVFIIFGCIIAYKLVREYSEGKVV